VRVQPHFAGPHGEPIGRLVLLGLEGVSEYIRQAHTAIQEHDPIAKGRAMERSYQIVSHLLVSIQESQSREAAQKLDRLYRRLLLQMAHANLFDDLGSLEDCRPILKELRAIWQDLL